MRVPIVIICKALHTLIILDNLCMHRTNKHGESESPCLKPLLGLKLFMVSPFHKIEKLTEETQAIIRFIECSFRLNSSSVALKKSYDILS